MSIIIEGEYVVNFITVITYIYKRQIKIDNFNCGQNNDQLFRKLIEHDCFGRRSQNTKFIGRFIQSIIYKV